MSIPKVSIIVPFKNTALFIKSMIDSVIAQTYSNWELIMVNDNSIDSSAKIVMDGLQKDNRIQLIQNCGSGITPALRTGFKHSKGELITRMDSDDLMTPLKLETMVKQLQVYGKGHIALGLVEYFSNQTLGNGYKKYAKWLNKLSSCGTNFLDIYKECSIPSPCWMVYKEDFLECGGFNSEEYPEDYDLAFRFYKKGLNCIPANQILHRWRDYPNRTSRTSEHYSDNRFLDLKLKYFLEIDYKSNIPLFLWGAGKKGKFIAKYLVKESIPFFWVCDNQQKIGHTIYKQHLKAYHYVSEFDNTQILISVANETSQQEIRTF